MMLLTLFLPQLRLSLFFSFFVLLFSGCASKPNSRSQSQPTSPPSSNASVDFTILSGHPEFPCLNASFNQFINVRGVYVIGTAQAPQEFVVHTAHVLAQFLDNDEDGITDDKAVVDYLTNNNYIVPVWSESERESVWDSIVGTDCEDNLGFAASMYYDEDQWALGGIEQQGTWDTNLEEVWHVVSVGWYATYPAYFGTELNEQNEVIPSKLTQAMDAARGGQFLTVPSSYPESAWYKYYDSTCDYLCQAHEYFYWILMANIDALSPDLTSKCADSQTEWFICTQQELQAQDPLAYELLNHEGFNLPTRIPDGSYH